MVGTVEIYCQREEKGWGLVVEPKAIIMVETLAVAVSEPMVSMVLMAHHLAV